MKAYKIKNTKIKKNVDLQRLPFIRQVFHAILHVRKTFHGDKLIRIELKSVKFSVGQSTNTCICYDIGIKHVWVTRKYKFLSQILEIHDLKAHSAVNKIFERYT